MTVLTHAQSFGGYRFLLGALLSLLALYPLVADIIVLRPVLDVLLLVTLWGCIRASSAAKPLRLTLIGVAVAVVVSAVLVDWHDHPGVYATSAIAGFVFFAAVTTILIRDVLTRMANVDANTLFAAINAYLLIGLTFAFGYMAVDALVPGSFDHSQILMGDANEAFESFLYFSYVTLTTLGFGDITPQSLEAGAFVYTEAMIGQLYLAVLVARLVGLYRSGDAQTGDAQHDSP